MTRENQVRKLFEYNKIQVINDWEFFEISFFFNYFKGEKKFNNNFELTIYLYFQLNFYYFFYFYEYICNLILFFLNLILSFI